jgi:hypothetical protein
MRAKWLAFWNPASNPASMTVRLGSRSCCLARLILCSRTVEVGRVDVIDSAFHGFAQQSLPVPTATYFRGKDATGNIGVRTIWPA